MGKWRIICVGGVDGKKEEARPPGVEPRRLNPEKPAEAGSTAAWNSEMMNDVWGAFSMEIGILAYGESLKLSTQANLQGFWINKDSKAQFGE